jgi:hypothetical protein
MAKRKRYPKRKTKAQPIHFKVGDSVITKSSVEDPDFGGDIGGWQGRVTAMRADEKGVPMLDLQWDSQTLRQIPGAAIEHCEEKGLDWSKMVLYADEVEPALARDKPSDVEQAIGEISSQYAWAYMGEQGKRIREALGDAEDDNDWEGFGAWEEYLEKRLVFPFLAEVSEWQERGPLQAGDKVKVIKILDIEYLYGILVDIRIGRRKYVFPLCDLEAVDKESLNYQLTDDYAVWFANR